MDSLDADRDLARLEAELRQLEAEYNTYFAGRLPRPPWETRSRVEALLKRYDRAPIQNYGTRFRFDTLQTRFAMFVDMWDRGQRAREEGRSGPFAPARQNVVDHPDTHAPQVVHVAAFQDPSREPDKLEQLYASVVAARRQTGSPEVPFSAFADLVKTQVERMQAGGDVEVAFRVSVKDGCVSLTARALKGAQQGGSSES